MEKSQFLYCPNLSNITVHQAKIVNYSNTVSSAIGLALILLLLSLLILYKAYKTTLQRLFFHYTTATAITFTSAVLNIELQFDVDRSFCSWLAFLSQWWYLTVQLFGLILIVHLSAATYLKLRSKSLLPCFSKISKRCAIVMEVLYTILAVLLPLSYLWMPIKQHKYGLSQSLCWIKAHDELCNRIKEEIWFYGALISFLRLLVTIVFLALIVMLHLVIMTKYQQNRDSRCNSLCRAVVLLVIFSTSVVAMLLDNIVSLPNMNPLINDFLYDLIYGLVQTIINALLPVGFAVYLYSPNKLRFKSLKKAAREWCKCEWVCPHQMRRSARHRARPPRGNRTENEDSHTFESSIHYSAPSHTTYSSPYTNEFTHITEIISTTDSETVPKYV